MVGPAILRPPAKLLRGRVGGGPEHLALESDGLVEVKVRAVEWLGHECLVFGTIGDTQVVVRQTGMASVQAGHGARAPPQPPSRCQRGAAARLSPPRGTP